MKDYEIIRPYKGACQVRRKKIKKGIREILLILDAGGIGDISRG
jgi:hypothetical protein